MFNTGGAVDQVEIHKVSENNNMELYDGEASSEVTNDPSSNRSAAAAAAAATISLKVRGSGRFGVYSSQRPLKCTVGGTKTEFKYDLDTGLTTFSIPVPDEEMYKWSIQIQV